MSDLKLYAKATGQNSPSEGRQEARGKRQEVRGRVLTLYLNQLKKFWHFLTELSD